MSVESLFELAMLPIPGNTGLKAGWALRLQDRRTAGWRGRALDVPDKEHAVGEHNAKARREYTHPGQAAHCATLALAARLGSGQWVLQHKHRGRRCNVPHNHPPIAVPRC